MRRACSRYAPSAPTCMLSICLLSPLHRGRAHHAARRVDGDGKADPDEYVLACGVEKRGDDAYDLAVPVDEGPSRIARVHGRIELDEALQRRACFSRGVFPP